MTVCLRLGRFFAAGGRTLFGVFLRTTIGTFGGVDEALSPPLQSRGQSFWGAHLTLRPQGALCPSIVQNRRERLEVCVGGRPSPLALCPQDITGRLGLGIREDAQELLGPRGEFACGAPSRFAPARARRHSFFIGWLLGGLGEVPEDG